MFSVKTGLHFSGVCNILITLTFRKHTQTNSYQLEVLMGKTALVACLLLIMLALAFGCAEDADRETVAETIDQSDYIIVFRGNTWPDVAFPHKEHADRETGVCLRCHYCEDFIDNTDWDCRACHSASNEEGFCDDDGIHGCTYMQCYNCHEGDEHEPGLNPGLDCIDCHY